MNYSIFFKRLRKIVRIKNSFLTKTKVRTYFGHKLPKWKNSETKFCIFESPNLKH